MLESGYKAKLIKKHGSYISEPKSLAIAIPDIV